MQKKTPSKKSTPTSSKDEALRPLSFAEYTGQSHMMQTLQVMVQAAKKRDEAVGHMLFSGPPGLGKTTIAHIVTNEMGSNLHMLAGPAIKGKADLVTALTKLKEKDVLFIDEIHRLDLGAEENLYPAVEDYYVDIKVGSGRGKRYTQMPLPKFTLLGATTRSGLVSSPMRTRMAKIFRMKYYEVSELASIAAMSAKKLGLDLTEAAAEVIAKRSRGTPRTANQHLRMLRDYATVDDIGRIQSNYVSAVLDECGVDRRGFELLDRLYLKALIETFDGGPVGLQTLSSVVGEEMSTIEEVVEPFMLREGFIKKESRGRTATPKAVTYFSEVSG